MGPDVGSCFDPADVAHVATVEQFEAALASVGPGAQQVIVVDDDLLGLGSYFIDGEVAIVASGPATLTGGFTNLFFVQPDAFLYLASLRIASGSFRMVSADGGLWVDDVVVSDYTIAARVTAEAHFRRSTLAASGLDSVVILSSGDLHIENSALGPGSDLGLSLTDGAVDVRYATIAGNASGVGCDASVEGESRNSIVASTGASSISGCEGLVWADDAVDAEGYGSQVGPYDDAWFTDPSQGDFHVTAAGQAALAGIADWDDGDPVADIDGDARPQREPGVPGIDEP